ncbi:ethylene-responsive transcription factor ERF027-like [Juglans microcarpa x Juglans regia]|uniref:ethylene-responsive transcription factor ERF027-like n=1 Tax=Juglans microcarpa x Juglans regia TaxID=2249226 RepID=UPI001B7E5075|nr:ethylene-responsive transcription factor ERF027-like [Juglans microcarpa x Juglans regia]
MANNPANVRQDDPQPQVPVPILSIQVPEPSFPANVRQEETTPRLSVPSPTTFEDPSPRPVPSPGESLGQQASGGSPKYRGVRSRSGKWVSEIREPRKTTRIWLGTYPSPEMAAAAYDVAALALKGPDASLNFPNSILSYPIPSSTSGIDIQAAAARAAEAMARKPETSESTEGKQETKPSENKDTTIGSSSTQVGEEYIDEEALLNMPNLLVDMAEGMLVSPPRIESKSSDDSDGEDLWSYS